MQYKNEVLKNGLTLLTCPMAHTHMASAALFLRGGAALDTRAERGGAHMLEHMCFRRCAHLPQTEFYRRIERIGGFLRGETYRDFMTFSLTVRPEFIRDALDILALLFEENGWTADDLRREREVVFRQIEDRYDPCGDLLNRAFFCGGTDGLPIIGTEGRVRRMTRPKLIACKERLFAARSALLALTGCISPGDRAHAAELFSRPAAGEAPSSALCAPALFQKRGGAGDTIYYEDCERAHVYIAFDASSTLVGYEAAQMIYNAMAAGLFAPLALKFREELGLLDTVDAGVEWYAFGGMVWFAFSIPHEALELFFETLSPFFTDFSADRYGEAFAFTRTFFTKNQWALLDRPDEYAFELGYGAMCARAAGPVEDFIARYDAIDFDRFCAAARALFRAENLTLAVRTDAAHRQVGAKGAEGLRANLEKER